MVLAHFDPRGRLSGQFVYPFSFTIPAGAPSSWKGMVGGKTATLQYKITVNCDMLDKMSSELSSSIKIMVVPPDPPQSKLAASLDDVVNVMKICKGRVAMSIVLDKSAYHPGDTVRIACAMNNNSSVNIRKLKAVLVNERTLAVDGRKSATTHTNVATGRCKGVGPHEAHVTRSLDLKIPLDVQQQCLGYTIRSFYFLLIKVSVPWGRSLTKKIPLCISSPVPVMQPQCSSLARPPVGYAPEVKPSMNLAMQPIRQHSMVIPNDFFKDVQAINNDSSTTCTTPQQAVMGSDFFAGSPMAQHL
jgi:hypothetical protein